MTPCNINRLSPDNMGDTLRAREPSDLPSLATQRSSTEQRDDWLEEPAALQAQPVSSRGLRTLVLPSVTPTPRHLREAQTPTTDARRQERRSPAFELQVRVHTVCPDATEPMAQALRKFAQRNNGSSDILADLLVHTFDHDLVESGLLAETPQFFEPLDHSRRISLTPFWVCWQSLATSLAHMQPKEIAALQKLLEHKPLWGRGIAFERAESAQHLAVQKLFSLTKFIELLVPEARELWFNLASRDFQERDGELETLSAVSMPRRNRNTEHLFVLAEKLSLLDARTQQVASRLLASAIERLCAPEPYQDYDGAEAFLEHVLALRRASPITWYEHTAALIELKNLYLHEAAFVGEALLNRHPEQYATCFAAACAFADRRAQFFSDTTRQLSREQAQTLRLYALLDALDS